MMKVMAIQVLRKIVVEIRSANFFTIMVMMQQTLQTFLSLHCAYARWTTTCVVTRVSLDSIHLTFPTRTPLWQLSRMLSSE